MGKLPAWADAILVPLISILLAAVLSAIIILAIGENPLNALQIMVTGAFGNTFGLGHTLYYATSFIFTGLAFAVASHAGLFNIGSEGQAMLGGLGVALICLMFPWPHWSIALLVASIGAALFGAAWALIPAYLQAARGSHIVITTIMFNLIAGALLNFLLSDVMRPPQSMDSASAKFPEATHLPTLHDILTPLGFEFSRSAPVNVSLFIALGACVLVYILIWRTRLGYEIRALGQSETASRYAGIAPVKIIVVAMLISGALSGLMAVNTAMGNFERLILNATEGAGFIGIAVALMGRNHPAGVFLAAMLFGFLYQGGAELALWTSIPRELIVVIQALVILFTGALDNMVRMPLERAYLALRREKG